MKKFAKYLYLVLLTIGAGISLVACSEEDSDSPFVNTKGPGDSTILIYAVATNSLSPNLVYDKQEMLMGAENINLERNNVLIYQAVYEVDEENRRTGNAEVSLIKLVKTKDGYDWKTIKEYDNNIASLDPQRISEVIDYVTNTFHSTTYGLVFWSHSTGSQPFLTGRSLESVSTKSGSADNELPQVYWFGEDKTESDNSFYHINVDELASVIPDNLFDYIWFDSCYMSNVESIYQFRNKCKTYIGYPTEVLDDGLPYHIVLPHMVGKNPQLVEAAKKFFEYYSGSFGTIAVIDMNNIEMFADFCSSIFESGIEISPLKFTKYSRSPSGPFYDLGDYVKAFASHRDMEITDEEWNSILDSIVLYRATTSGRLLQLSIDEERFSGISTHIYTYVLSSDSEDYYKSLDWFKTVF